MEYTDYYKVLGVARDAKQAEIKRAYRKLARKYHPDVSEEKDAAAKFKEVGEAYAVLKDPEKRAAYDQLGANWKAGQDFRPPPGWDQGFEYGGGFDPAVAAVAASIPASSATSSRRCSVAVAAGAALGPVAGDRDRAPSAPGATTTTRRSRSTSRTPTPAPPGPSPCAGPSSPTTGA